MSISPKALKDRVKSVANIVVSKVVGYNAKTPEMWDFYEGEAPLNWDSICRINPIRIVFQATVGQHGRHNDNKPDRAVSLFVKGAQVYKQKYGLYHLLLPNGIPEQAQFYINTVESLGGLGNMMPIMDVEVDWLRGSSWAGMIAQWKDIVEAHFNQKILCYTSKYYASFANDKNGNPPACFKDMYGWMAGYLFLPYFDANPTMPHSYLANGFTDWAAWQYFDKGRSSPPRGFSSYPANDLSLVSPSFASILNEFAVLFFRRQFTYFTARLSIF